MTVLQVGDVLGKLTIEARGPDKLYTHQGGHIQRHPTWRVRCVCGRVYLIIGFRLKGKNAVRSCIKCAHAAKQINGRLSYHYFRRIRISARLRSIAFNDDVTSDYLTRLLAAQGGLCALSGLPIGFAASVFDEKHGKSTASLDRIDNARGYEVGNLQWLHKDVNKLKNTFNQAYVVELSRAITANHERSR